MKKKKAGRTQPISPEEEPLTSPESSEEKVENMVDEEEVERSRLPIDDGDISDWYQDEDESQVDMSKLERRLKRQKGPWLIGILIILVLVAALSFSYVTFISQRPSTTGGSGVLDMQVPEKTASGEVVVIELTYENTDTVAFRTGKIEVVYPDGFVFQSADPAATTGQQIWTIDGLESGRGGKIYITGQLVGEVGSEKTFTSFLTYRPENLNYDFQETTQDKMNISSSTISVDLDSPQTARTGETIELKAHFTNASKSPLTDIKIFFTPPADFSLTSTEPEAEAATDLSWKFDELQPGETQTITLKGVVQGESGQQQAFTWTAGFVEIDGRFNAQIEKQALLLLVNPSVALEIIAPQSVAPGEELEYTVSVENTSDVNIEQVKIRLLLEGEFFEEEQLDLPVIESLGAHESTTLSASTTIKSEAKARNLDLSAVASVRSVSIDGQQTTVSATATATTTVEGSLSFSAQARYFDDDLQKVGNGPVPPEVGSQTTYEIWWDVSSGPSDIKQLTVAVTLPDDVTFESGDSDISYEEKTRTVSYSTSVLKAGATQHLEFFVSITPTPDDFNTLMVLAEAGAAQAIDTSSDEALSSEVERLTTNLDGDPAAEGKGVVE